MSQFERGLTQKALEEAKDFFRTDVGRGIKNNKNCLICIRKNYLNVYYNGCSLLKYTPLSSDKKYRIHKAYLSSAETKGEKDIALQFSNGDLTYKGDFSFTDAILKTPSLALQNYIEKDGEKRAIAYYLDRHKPLMIDLEIAFGIEKAKAENSKARKKVALRIDMAVINDENRLEFIEVKLSGDNRLRAVLDGKQEIIEQMEYYESFIENEKDNILSSYKTIIENYKYLGLIERVINANADYEKRLEAFLKKPEVESKPTLLIIGSVENMRKGSYGDHYKRLEDRGYRLIQLE